MATLDDPTITPENYPFPKWGYPLFFGQLYRKFGWRAFVRQFRFAHRRPFSRGLIRAYAPQGLGLEIGVGAFTVSPVRRTILTDGFREHASESSIARRYCPADRIPARDATFDFLVSEHTLEHLCNPVAGLLEWARVLKPGARIFLFLPHRDRTFDRRRERTRLEHLWEDYRNGVSDPDSTHLAEWKEKVVDSGLAPSVYTAVPLLEHVTKGLIHHHVWITEDMRGLLESMGFKILFSADQCPDRGDSFVIVAEIPRDARIAAPT